MRNIFIKCRLMTGKSSVRLWLLLLIILLSMAGMWLIGLHARAVEGRTAGSVTDNIAGKIIRFHVIANSDGKRDQLLKLKVRDALIDELSPYLDEAADIESSRRIIEDKIPALKELAEKVLTDEGSFSPVTVTLGNCYFPLKVYGNYTFPPGTYEALQVKIGKASGKNWWCVMFPPLCLVDETYNIVDEEGDKKLQLLLDEDEYEALLEKDVPVKVKFKLWKYIKKLFSGKD